MPTHEIICGDALTEIPRLVERGVRVSLVNADIPYFKVKADEWDRQWKTEADFLAWVDALCSQLKQILQPNGSLYLYASPQMARKVGNAVAEHFNILQEITWNKAGADYKPGDARATAFKAVDVSGLRKFFEHSERVIFAERYGADAAANPMAEYLKAARISAGLTCDAIERRLGYTDNKGRGSRLFYRWETGGSLPSETDFYRALEVCGVGCGVRYEDLRRPFTVSTDAPYTDVWAFPTVTDYPGRHSCEKPYAMMEHVVRASSREGDTVLDCCAGSGVFSEAALMNGRDVIAIERDEWWSRKVEARAARVVGQTVRMPHAIKADRPAPLFDAIA